MSSVVKKGSRFMPKFKKQPIKKKSVTPVAAPPTPIATQITEEPEEEQEFVDAPSTPEVGGALDFKFSISNSTLDKSPAPISSVNTAEDVDPMDTTKKIQSEVTRSNAIATNNDETAEHDGDDEGEDEDLFKKPDDSTHNGKFRRQSSIHYQRRLLGITPMVIRGRSGSVSVTPTPAPESAIEDEEESSAPPVIIGIPTSKPTKRRKSSVSSMRSKRGLVFLPVSKDNSPLILEEPETKKRKYSVGIDPNTQKLTKYVIVERGDETTETKEVQFKGEAGSKIETIEDREPAKDTKATVDDDDAKNEAAAALLGLNEPSASLTSRSASSTLPSSAASAASAANSSLLARNKSTIVPALTAKISLLQGQITPLATQILPPLLDNDFSIASSASQADIPKRSKADDVKEFSSALPDKIYSMSQVSRSWKDDPSVTEGITIIPEEMRMADLCLPSFSIGKPSTKYKQVLEAKVHQEKLQRERREIRKLAREQKKSIEEVSGEKDDRKQQQKKKDIINDLPDGDSKAPTLTLQLRVVGGTIAVDMDSTSVSRGLNNLNSEKDREEANPFNNPITSSSYSKRRYTDRWSAEEVSQFYKALSTWGTDFTFIAQLFPHRTRKQIKLKFNLEEKKHPEIVDLALRMKLPADFDQYCFDSNKEILSLDEYNDQLKAIRVKHEDDMKQIVAQKEQAKKEDEEARRRREYEYRTGTKQMSRSERARELRKNEVVLGSIAEKKVDEKKNYDP